MADPKDAIFEFNITQTTKVAGTPGPAFNLTFKVQGMKQESFVVPKGTTLPITLPSVSRDELQFLMIAPTLAKPAAGPDSVQYYFGDSSKPLAKDAKPPWINLQGAHTFFNGAQRFIPVDELDQVVVKVNAEQAATITIVMGYNFHPDTLNGAN